MFERDRLFVVPWCLRCLRGIWSSGWWKSAKGSDGTGPRCEIVGPVKLGRFGRPR
jgi:hypothetical protein